MKLIPLKNGKSVKVDDDIFDEISDINWHEKRGYIVHSYYVKETQKTGKSLYLHRYIMKPGDGEFVDHINGDKLDNQRSNLRLCSSAQNMWNRPKFTGSNPYKGVQPNKSRKNPWVAFIRCNRIVYYLGSHPTAEKAARAYNAKAIELHGEFAYLNNV